MKTLITTICSFLFSLIGYVLTPIDSIIMQYLPSIYDALVQVAAFFGWLVQFVNWALSWLPLSANTWSFIIVVLLFRINVPFIVDTIKMVVRWWHELAP